MQDHGLSLARRVLGVEPHATEIEIRRAARRLALKVHPDLGGTALQLRCVLQARAVLLDAKQAGHRRAA